MGIRTKLLTIDELIDEFKKYNDNEEDIKLIREC